MTDLPQDLPLPASDDARSDCEIPSTVSLPREWRGLEELAETPEFLERLYREFPRQADEWMNDTNRREFLQRMAASLGLAGIGLSGCIRQPEEKIVPYVRQPEDFVPGKPLFYATCTTLGGYATGLLVESHLGRPTKIEGNPEHPASLGATDVFAQASILSLYDPDRSQTVKNAGRISTWGEFLTALTNELPRFRSQKGQGLAILTGTVTSPTLVDQLKSLQRDLPKMKWHQYEPINRDNVRAGAQLAFGEDLETIYHFEKARIVVSLDADFLAGVPGAVRYARDFIDRRRIISPDSGATSTTPEMTRLYALESTPGLTGVQADHRIALRARDVETVVQELARRLKIKVAPAPESTTSPIPSSWLEGMISDLQRHQGASLVIAGDGQPAAVHAMVHAINHQLGNWGSTIEYTAPVEAEPVDQLASLTSLVNQMSSGDIKMLIMLGGNPVYNSPAELDFRQACQKVPFRVHVSPEYDETSYEAHWHIPAAHSLETWSDARAFDGTCSIQQPLIAPLYGGRSDHEVLAALAGHPEHSSYQLVQDYWRRQWSDGDFDVRWRRAVHDGVIAGTRSASVSPEGKFSDPVEWTATPEISTGSHSGDLEVTFCADPTVWDGRFANNGWLQELPKPLTKLTWDNAALISPGTANRLGLVDHELVELTVQGRTLRVAVLILPGQPDNSLSISLGYGRTRSGRLGNQAGFNAYSIRPASSPWFTVDVQLRPLGKKYEFAITQLHHSMEGRPLIQTQSLTGYQQHPEFIPEEYRHPSEQPTLYPKGAESEYAWGMVIDQTACIGCNACVVACQAENNTPIVGKTQVRIGREMHWIRIDRYYRGDAAAPETDFQPVMCVHCENAPCELVCPVAATVHSHEGLNQMVYNRCVGTRYCSNNCPYKVRRFNFLDYQAEQHEDGDHAPSLALLRNPDVTVRSRGVMEKCTYCIQRINEVKIEAQKASRSVRDGEIQTACQQVCPARAISFGNLHDSQSVVSQQRESPLNYSLLAELNTLPRTTHLARVRNPNGEMPQSESNPTSAAPSLKSREGS